MPHIIKKSHGFSHLTYFHEISTILLALCSGYESSYMVGEKVCTYSCL